MAMLRRELDWIVMKCLEKQRARRYETANGLARDIQRYLNNEPVEACPPSTLYRLRKFAGKNRAALTTAAALVLLLIAGITASTWQAVRATRAETKAEQEQIRANAEKLKSQRMSADLAFDRGVQNCEEGKVNEGLLWLAESLAINPEEHRDFADMVRMNLAAWGAPLTIQRRVIPHENAVHAVAYSPDGKIVFTASGGAVRRLDALTGEPIGKDLVQPGEILCFAISPDGRRIATGSIQKEVRIWDLEREALVVPPIPQPDEVNTVAFSPDGSRLAVGTGYRDVTGASSARVWDVASGKAISPPLPHMGAIRGIIFQEGGSRIITGAQDGMLRTFEVSSGRLVREPHKFPAEITAMAPSVDNFLLAIGCSNGDAHVCSAPGGEFLGPTLHHPTLVRAIAFSPDQGLVVTGCHDSFARLWEWRPGDLVGGPLLHENYVYSVAFSPDGHSLITGSLDGKARVWDLPLGSRKGMPLIRSDATLALANLDRSMVSGRPRTRITGSQGRPIPHWVWEYLCASFSPDGRLVVIGSTDHRAYVREVATGRLVGKPLDHANWVRAVAFASDNRRVLTASHDMTARLWDGLTGEPLGPILHHASEIIAVAISPDGKKGLTGGMGDGIARLWNLDSGEPIGPPMLHRGPITSVTFSPDGRFALTTSFDKDGEARLWDTRTAKPIGPSVRHQQVAITAARFDDDGKTFLTLGDDATARRWPMPQLLPGDPDLVRTWAQVITGQEQDAGKSVAILEPAAWEKRRQQVLDSTLRSKFDRGPEAIVAWHDFVAGGHELTQNGGTALWHLDRLQQARPRDWSVHARWVGPLHRYGFEKEALQHLELARELGGLPAVQAWCTERAENHERVHQHETALWFRKWLAIAAPRDAEVQDALGHCLARLGRFTEAVEHFDKAATLAPGRIDFQRDLAMVRLALDDRPGYRKACARLLELATATDDLEAACTAALTCVFDPKAVEHWGAVVRLAARCAEAYDGDSRLHVAALFRAGLFEEAQKIPFNMETRYSHIVWEWLFQGMLRLRSERGDEGRSIVEQKIKMIEFMDKEFPRDPKSKVWSDWIYYVQCHVLCKEAEALLQGAAGRAAPPR
jgi:WD40 repeat protein/tetratricopeptide (TPR) repeat protein